MADEKHFARIKLAGIEAQTGQEGVLLKWSPHLTIMWGDDPAQLNQLCEFDFSPRVQSTPELALAELRKALGDGETIEVPGTGIKCRIIQKIASAPTDAS